MMSTRMSAPFLARQTVWLVTRSRLVCNGAARRRRPAHPGRLFMAEKEDPYREDLAYIHDVGFSAFALQAAPGLLALLRRGGVTQGLVVDLGCGTGLWAAELLRAGYQVLGVDVA